jgi:hypothetical protein
MHIQETTIYRKRWEDHADRMGEDSMEFHFGA